MNKTRYHPETLRSLNCKNIYPIEPSLLDFFNTFQKTRYPNVTYQNPYNPNFVSHRKKLFPTHEPFSDEKILADFKANLTKLTRENEEEITNLILQLHFPPGIEDKAAEVFHETVLSCIFLADVYVDLLLKMKKTCTKIVESVNQIVSQQLYHPREFSTANDEIACETAEQKAKKWRINNGLLIAELFLQGKYHHQFMINNIIVPIINHITIEDTINIEVLNKIMPLILPKLASSKANLSGIFYQLTKISQDKSYPSRLRYLLMDITDLQDTFS